MIYNSAFSQYEESSHASCMYITTNLSLIFFLTNDHKILTMKLYLWNLVLPT